MSVDEKVACFEKYNYLLTGLKSEFQRLNFAEATQGKNNDNPSIEKSFRSNGVLLGDGQSNENKDIARAKLMTLRNKLFFNNILTFIYKL